MTEKDKQIQDLTAKCDALQRRYDHLVQINSVLVQQVNELECMFIEAQTKLADAKLFINTKYDGEMA